MLLKTFTLVNTLAEIRVRVFLLIDELPHVNWSAYFIREFGKSFLRKSYTISELDLRTRTQ